MALKRSGMVEVAVGAAALSLEMKANESARIRDIWYGYCTPGAVDHKITIDRKSMMHFIAPETWYLWGADMKQGKVPLADAFWEAGLWPTIPLAKGETLGITAPGTDNFMEAIYDLYDADDVRPDEPNGSLSTRYRMFQVISNAAIVTAAGDAPLDASDTATEFPAFPGGEAVPANIRIELLGLFGSPCVRGCGTTVGQYTTRLKFLREREDLFDKDLGGVVFRGDTTYKSAALKYQADPSRLIKGGDSVPPGIITYDPPIVFTAGQELNVFATVYEVTAATGDFQIGEIKLGLIMDVIKV